MQDNLQRCCHALVSRDKNSYICERIVLIFIIHLCDSNRYIGILIDNLYESVRSLFINPCYPLHWM